MTRKPNTQKTPKAPPACEGCGDTKSGLTDGLCPSCESHIVMKLAGML